MLIGVGRQSVGWALVSGAIAVWAATHVKPPADSDAAARKRARRLAAVTGANALADVGYLAGAAQMLRTPRRRADGVGIAVQAAFLLWLDSRHAAKFIGHARADRSVKGG